MRWLLSRDTLSRFAGKFVHDLLPAALASVIGGMLFSQLGKAPAAPPPQPSGNAQAAGEEMVQMLRDEHALLIEFLKKDAEAKVQGDAAVDAAAKAKLALAEQAEEKLRAAQQRAAALAASRQAAAKLADKTEKADKTKVAAREVKEPLQIVPAMATDMPVAAEPAMDRPKRETGFIANVREVAGNVIDLPSRAWSATTRWLDEIATPKLPPLPVPTPTRHFEARM